MSIDNQYKRISNSWPLYLRRLVYPDKRKDLQVKDLLELLKRQNYRCALTGELLTCSLNKGIISLTNASVDRIIPGGPYTLDNIRLVCRIANIMKWNMFDAELKEWCRKILHFGT